MPANQPAGPNTPSERPRVTITVQHEVRLPAVPRHVQRAGAKMSPGHRVRRLRSSTLNLGPRRPRPCVYVNGRHCRGAVAHSFNQLLDSHDTRRAHRELLIRRTRPHRLCQCLFFVLSCVYGPIFVLICPFVVLKAIPSPRSRASEPSPTARHTTDRVPSMPAPTI